MHYLTEYMIKLVVMIYTFIRAVALKQQYPYQIAEINKSKSVAADKVVLRVSATDKVLPPTTLLNLFHDEKLLAQLAPTDIKQIAALAALIQKQQQQYEMTWLSEDGRQVVLTRQDKADRVECPLKDVLANKALIEKLTPHAAFSLGKLAVVCGRDISG